MKWEVKPWRDIVEIKSGRNQKDVKNSDGKYPIYGSGGIMGYADDFICDEGTTIIGRKGTINKPIFVEEKFWNVDTAFGLTPSKLIDHRFLFYFCLGYDFTKHDKGTTLPSLVKKDLLANVFMPVPPIAEQKRIVEILDESSAGIERAEAIARQNLTNARELFDSYLNKIFKENHKEWRSGKLEDLIGSVCTGPFGSLLHKSDYVENGIPLVNPANIEGDQIIPNMTKTVEANTIEKLKNYVLSEKDIVFGRRGEIGRCAVINKDQEGWLCGTGCFFIRPKEDINPIFIAHLLRSQQHRNKLESLATGATMKNLSNTTLANFIISIPFLKEQEQILKKLEELQNKTQEIEDIYQRKLEALAELKQSILQKAFTGQLTQ